MVVQLAILTYPTMAFYFFSGALRLPEKYEKPICGITRNIRQGPGIPFELRNRQLRKLSHNGCTAGNFDLPDHGFLLLTCSTGPME
jgi:hypothetical protein